MSVQKKLKTTQFIVVILLALTVYFFMKNPLIIVAPLIVAIVLLIIGYFKIPKFHAWVNGKFHKVKKPETTASIRQDNGIKSATAAAYLCNGCGGQLQPVANWPKFMACEKCHKVQQKIN
ncbi:MAG: hypothetical protein WC365_03695 [Candidatus Babeliales bacterium]|jgi:hypothetical protein